MREQVGRGRIQDNFQTTIYTLSGTFTGDGRAFRGVFTYSHRNRARQKYCATRSEVLFRLSRVDVVAPWDAGHYAGTLSNGRSIAFDLTYDASSRRASIVNLIWRVGPLDCMNVYTNEQIALTTTLTLSGPVHPSGEFGFGAPHDSITRIDGTLIRGHASGKVQLGQLFDTDGTPDDHGQVFCPDVSGWFNTFTARRG